MWKIEAIVWWRHWGFWCSCTDPGDDWIPRVAMTAFE